MNLQNVVGSVALVALLVFVGLLIWDASRAQALATFVVGFGAATFAYLKWSDDRFKLKHELFSKRFEIFEVTGRYLRSGYNGTANDDPALIRSFLDARDRARFLFGPEVFELMTKIYELSIEAGNRNSDKEQDRIALNARKELFRMSIDPAFRKYLKLDDPL